MHHALAKEHRDFFQKHGWIEFDDLLTGEQIVILKQGIEEALSKRLELPPSLLAQLNPEQIFSQSRDLWRTSENLRKVISNKKFGAIVSELIGKRTLRLGFDFYLPPLQSSHDHSSLSSPFLQFINASSTLQQISCIDNTLCGILLCLSHTSKKEQQTILNDTTPDDLFPKSVGSAVFINTHTEFDRRQITLHPNCTYYLIVFAQNISHYIEQTGDPHGSYLKRQGFVYNDRLNDRSHPIIHR